MTVGFYSGDIYLVAELLLAELIFLYPAPKRRGFGVKLPLLSATAILFSAYVHLPYDIDMLVLFSLGRSLIAFVLSTAVMAACFHLPPRALISMCVAGYATQHIAYRTAWLISLIPLLSEIDTGEWTRDRIIEIIIMICIYAVMAFTLGRFSAKYECYKSCDNRLAGVSILIVFICIFLSRISRLFGEGSATITGSVYSVVACILALYIQFNLHQVFMLESENRTIDRIRQEERKQYEITKNTMESLNIRLHDAKHKLTAYHDSVLSAVSTEVEELERDIGVYDSIIKIGNEVLDVLLIEKSIKCQAKGIRFTCSGDYSSLSFMATMDLYSLFGNAVDNAIEAVENLENEKKIIDVSVEQRGGLVFINFTNYFNGKLTLQGGLPQTTKTEGVETHGFGMKSMKRIAERYNGDLTVSTRGELFCLNIYLQKP